MPIEFIDLKAQYAALKVSISARIQAVLDHGQYIMGPEVPELEQKLADFTGTKHCITCASGTDALLISLMALGIKPGDEVITPAFSFIAAAEMIALLGAKPVFVDIQPDTFNIDPTKIEAAITSRTRAIIPISLYGQPADMDEINAIARTYNLPVVEDAAQSFGAEYKGRKSCNLSTIGCTSFFPSKPLGCYGDGGAIFTNDPGLAMATREIRVHGQSQRYVHTRVGIAGRMDTIQCAVVLAKLERFEWEIKQRQRVAARYSESLRKLGGGIRVPAVKADRTSVYAQYTLLTKDRDKIQKKLSELGIPTAIHYPKPIHKQLAYANTADLFDLAISEKLVDWVISLPMHPDMNENTQDSIMSAVAKSLAT